MGVVQQLSKNETNSETTSFGDEKDLDSEVTANLLKCKEAEKSSDLISYEKEKLLLVRIFTLASIQDYLWICFAGLAVTLLLILQLGLIPLPGYGLPRQIFKSDKLDLSIQSEGNSLQLSVSSIGLFSALTGLLGIGLPEAIGAATNTCNPGESDLCFEYGDYARLYVTDSKESNDNCMRIEWYSPYAKRLEDCYDLKDGVHWYGGGGPTYFDTWPIEKVGRREAPIVAGDSLGGMEYGGVTENYWLTTSGVAIHVDEDVPLWMSIDYDRQEKICFVAQDSYPYKPHSDGLRLKYNICTGNIDENFKDVHQRAIGKYYTKPVDIPDERMMVEPFWSTWAEYKTGVNQTLVLELADRLQTEGFAKSSHIEIDDDWETCYGEAEFNAKFPDPSGMTAYLKDLNLRTTLWTHPFINYNCPSFNVAMDKGYLVKDEKSKTGLTSWWQGSRAGIIDFTNEGAVKWWGDRLEKIRQDYGVDSFKFDAGEMSWLPYSHKLTGDASNDPNLATTKYVDAVARFGNMLEVRVGRQNQNHAVFTRMLDKDSRWGYDNGLQSLIPTLLDFGLKRYPFVLPDMIGGNAYGVRPSKELFIRWMQTNSFMPSVQFSILPWDYDEETVGVVKEIIALREKYADSLIAAARQSVEDGSPINRPMWWVDPKDINTYTIDDQYMLGDDILVAPVLIEKATSRNIYLPKGTWTGSDKVVYKGPVLLENFNAPLGFLPYFVRASETKDLP